jgi:hypothetical protein
MATSTAAAAAAAAMAAGGGGPSSKSSSSSSGSSSLAGAIPSGVRKLPLVLQQAREHALLGHYDKALELHAKANNEVMCVSIDRLDVSVVRPKSINGVIINRTYPKFPR